MSVEAKRGSKDPTYRLLTSDEAIEFYKDKTGKDLSVFDLESLIKDGAIKAFVRYDFKGREVVEGFNEYLAVGVGWAWDAKEGKNVRRKTISLFNYHPAHKRPIVLRGLDGGDSIEIEATSVVAEAVSFDVYFSFECLLSFANSGIGGAPLASQPNAHNPSRPKKKPPLRWGWVGGAQPVEGQGGDMLGDQLIEVLLTMYREGSLTAKPTASKVAPHLSGFTRKGKSGFMFKETETSEEEWVKFHALNERINRLVEKL